MGGTPPFFHIEAYIVVVAIVVYYRLLRCWRLMCCCNHLPDHSLWSFKLLKSTRHRLKARLPISAPQIVVIHLILMARTAQQSVFIIIWHCYEPPFFLSCVSVKVALAVVCLFLNARFLFVTVILVTMDSVLSRWWDCLSEYVVFFKNVGFDIGNSFPDVMLRVHPCL